MASRFVTPFFDSGNGIQPSDGSKLFFFSTGTSTPKNTFSDEALTTPNANPVIADANGLFSDIWMPDGSRYKVQLKDKNDVQEWESDPVVSGVSAALTSKTFDTVAAMVASTELNIGDIVETAGYLSTGDGGQNQYEIVAAATGTDDGGSFIDLATHQAKGLFPGGFAVFEQYGAKGDNVADDTAELQATLDSTHENIKGIATSDYRTTAALTITTSAKILDLDGATITLDDAGGTLDVIIIGDGITQVNAVTLRNGVIKRSQVATAGNGIFLKLVGVLEINNIRVFGENKIFRGINFDRSIIANVRDCYIQDTVSDGVFLKGTGTGNNRVVDTTIHNCRIESVGGAGISSSDFVEGLFIRDNIIFSPTGAGVSINSSSDANGLISFKIFNNDIDTAATGLFIQNVSNISINDNWFSNNTGINIDMRSTVDSATVVGNQAYGIATQNNFELAGTAIVVDSNLLSAGKDGINLKAAATRITIVGNEISNMTERGVNNFLVPTDVIIVSNRFNNNTLEDVTTGGTGLIINHNGGHVTENSGSDSIASGTTSTVITHGLSVTPLAEHITIVGKENPTNDIGNIFVDTITSTQFTVRVRNDPGASNWDFGWKVIVV